MFDENVPLDFWHNAIVQGNRSSHVLPGEEEQRATQIIDSPIVPSDYYIRIQPYFPTDKVQMPKDRNMTFDGLTTILFTVRKSTKSFKLHSVNLFYSENAKIWNADSFEEIEATFTENKTLQAIEVTTSSAEKLVEGESYMIQFKYTGKINSYMDAGIYYTLFVDVDGVEHWMIATQMEPASARTVFPCIDDPGYKAVFHLTLIYPHGYIALANSMEREPIALTKDPDSNNGWDVIQFPKTLRMSTYIVAFAIGPFVSKESKTNDGVLIRVWGWTGQEEYLKNAVSTTVSCLETMTNFTNFKFPMDKSDQLGLPEFVAGAMENYGLIIYKYQYIAFNPKIHTTYSKQAAVRVVCHELAHQWFGDTVSAQWWDDLFLQEGMAAFFENYAPRQAFPEQSSFLESKFLVESFQAGLNSDAITSTNDTHVAVSHPIFYPDGPAFDDITYLKGSSVLRMIQATLGEDVFQDALRKYLKKYEFSNANHAQFFQELTNAASQAGVKDWCGQSFDADKWLTPWFVQQGFPLITVTDNQPGTSLVNVQQQPFNNLNPELGNYTYNYTWPIPLFVKGYSNNVETIQWLVPEYASKNCVDQSKPKPQTSSHGWIMYNSNSKAFVRTQYDDIAYSRLLKKIQTDPSQFTIADHIILIGDQIALLNKKRAEGKQFTFHKVLDMIDAILPTAASFGTFELTQNSFLNAMEKMFLDSADYKLFAKFVRRLIGDSYQKLGWKVTGNWEQDVSRYLIFPYAVRYDLADAASESKNLSNKFLDDCKDATKGISNCSQIHPDLRLTVYCSAVKQDTENKFFDALMTFYEQQYKNEFYFYEEYYSMLQGMACTTNKENIERLISVMLTTYRLPQNKYKLAALPFYFLTQVPKSSYIMADYLAKNYSQISASGTLEEYLNSMISTWYFKGQLKKYNDVYAQLKSSLSVDDNALFGKYNAVLTNQVEIGDRYYPDMVRFLYDNTGVVKENKENWPQQEGSIVVQEYELSVKPYVPGSAKYEWWKNMTFDGDVQIRGSTTATTLEIVLNAHRMIIEPDDITINTTVTTSVTDISKDYDKGLLRIQLSAILPPNTEFSIQIHYKGFIFGVPKKGVYTNTNYFEFNDKKGWIFATYFESGPSARSLVPCVDDPNMKAVWKVSLRHPSDTIALGNMPDLGTTYEKNGWTVTRFMPTPPMSSYLLSLACGHFASLQAVSNNDVLVRAWAWTGMEQYAEHALKTVTGTVDFMSEYFNYTYPLPKLDVLALPQYTMAGGAEEHWGFIHARYQRELIDPMYGTTEIYMNVASVCAHETIHQWFGDLVTMKAWNEVFLNEGFANYWETNGILNAFPEQKSYEAFERFRKLTVALTYDTNEALTKPIIANEPSYFTGVTYYKGATMLHMLSGAIGADKLQAGLQKYLRDYAFKNAKLTDLWEAIETAVNKTGSDNRLSISEIMEIWMHKSTLPVLKVEKDSNGIMHYTQEPYLKGQNSDISTITWNIPVWSKKANESEVLHYFIGKNGGSDEYWSRKFENNVIDNVGYKAYVMVWYSDDIWAQIYKQLTDDLTYFDEISRAQFITDSYYLLKRGSLDWSRVMDLGKLLSNENSLAPFYALKKVIDELLVRFRYTSHLDSVMDYFKIANLYDKYAWKSSKIWTENYLSALVTEYACKLQLPQCLKDAKKKFEEFARNCQYSVSGTRTCNTLQPDFRRTQYCYGLKQVSEHKELVKKLYTWSATHAKYFDRDTDNLLYALSCVANESMLEDTFNGVYPAKAFEYIAENFDGEQALQYLIKHPEMVFATAEVSDFIQAFAATLNTQQQLISLTKIDEILKSKEDHEVLLAAQETVNANIAWITTNTAAGARLMSSLNTQSS
uniref:Aminopeptidase n=1 Tax=Syphacia muris TaxID=451379 RepID=A0A158R4C2_9BILA